MDSAAALVEIDRRHLIHPLHHSKDHEHPVLVVEGRGEILIDAEGKQYIDGLSSLWNVNAGHGRKELADAAAAQMAKLSFASAYVGASNIPSIRLAEKLVKLAYPSTSAVYFTTAGAESNESAFKIARYYWKLRGKPEKVKIFSRVHAYHGLTMAAMSATGMAVYHKMFGPLVPNFLQVPAPYPYRWPGNDDPGIGAAEAFEQALVREGPETVAAIIAEPVMGAGGVIVPPATYFPRLREICDRHGILLIADVLERAKSTDPDAIVEAIRKTNWSAGLMQYAGPVVFNETGDNPNAVTTMLQILGGKPVAVWPKEAALQKFVFPRPKA